MLINFETSFISWKTLDGSLGKFKTEAYLRYKDREWLLGSEVTACNVYSQKDLLKTPPYSFQALFSKDECRIFRTYYQSGKTDDTIFQPSEQFKVHKVEIVSNFLGTEIKPEKSYDTSMTCVVEIEDYEIQFPVKHMNFLENDLKFQVETGPVALPFKNSIARANIVFNNLNSFEALVFTSENGVRNFSPLKQNNCLIKFFKS